MITDPMETRLRKAFAPPELTREVSDRMLETTLRERPDTARRRVPRASTIAAWTAVAALVLSLSVAGMALSRRSAEPGFTSASRTPASEKLSVQKHGGYGPQYKLLPDQQPGDQWMAVPDSAQTTITRGAFGSTMAISRMGGLVLRAQVRDTAGRVGKGIPVTVTLTNRGFWPVWWADLRLGASADMGAYGSEDVGLGEYVPLWRTSQPGPENALLLWSGESTRTVVTLPTPRPGLYRVRGAFYDATVARGLRGSTSPIEIQVRK